MQWSRGRLGRCRETDYACAAVAGELEDAGSAYGGAGAGYEGHAGEMLERRFGLRENSQGQLTLVDPSPC